MVISRLHVLDNSLLQLGKCPVCFGIWENVCKAITSGTLKVKQEYFWKSESMKGVRFGIWGSSLVVVKQLGYGNELAMLDQEICLNTTEPVSKYCNVHENVWRSFLNPGVSFKRLTRLAIISESLQSYLQINVAPQAYLALQNIGNQGEGWCIN